MKSITSTIVALWVISLTQNLFAKGTEVDQVDYPLKNWTLICDFLVKCAKANHLGLDGKDSTYAAVAGTPVFTPAHGVVKEAQYHSGYGGTVIIEHFSGDESFTSVLGHLNTSTLVVGPEQEVQRGDLIGYLGTKKENGGYTPHLHWGVRKGPYQSTVIKCASGKEWSYAGYPTCSTTFEDWYDPKVLVAMDFDPDADQDGYTVAQGDCNDNDQDINPDVEEFCDGIDNNCNSQTDENWAKVNQPCSKVQGICVTQGTWVCATDQKSVICTAPNPVMEAEKCDNQDNDCDGLTDEDFKKGLAQDLGNPCTVGLGACQNQGQMVCTKDGKATVCSVDPLSPQPEKCDDDKDSNCDGTVGEWKPETATLKILNQDWNLSFLRLRFNPATGIFGLLRNEANIRFHEIDKQGQVLSSKTLVSDVSINLYVGFELTASGYVLTWQDKDTKNIWWMIIDHHGEIIATQILAPIPYGCDVYSVSLGYHPISNSYGFAWHFSGSPVNGCQPNLFTVMDANGGVVLPLMSIQFLSQNCCYTTGPVLTKDDNFVVLFGKGYGTYFTEVDLAGQTLNQFYAEVNGDVMFFNEFNIVWTGQYYGAFFGDFFEFNAQGNKMSSFNANDGYAIWDLPHLIWNGNEYATTATTSKYVPGWGNKNTGILFGRLSGKQWLTPLVYLTEDEYAKKPSVAWDGERYAIVWNKELSILMRFVSCQ